jgi:adenosylhomocysteine nucleosidase
MKSTAEHLRSRGGILVCFALKEEAAPFRKGTPPGPAISLLVTGIGKVNAEKSLRQRLAVETNIPAWILTGGFAGGLSPELRLGDVLFETADADLRARLLLAGARPAAFFCADRIATTVREKQALRAGTGADVVDMESGAIQAVCRERGIPCATVRVISDTAGEDLPLDFNALAKPDKNLDFGKLLLAIARSPGKIGALMELQKKTSFAARQLAAVLTRVTCP